MRGSFLLLPVIVPAAFAALSVSVPKRSGQAKEALCFFAALIDLVCSILMFGKTAVFDAPWMGFGISMSFKLYQFNGFMLLTTSALAFLLVIYSIAYMRGREHKKLFYGNLLLTLSLIDGALLSNNLIALLFFWEGLLIPLFGMIMSGGKKASGTAVKALVLSGTADLCMTIGICLTAYLSNGQLAIDSINLPLDFMGSLAFVFLMIGATAKAGSMPFHTWIPDASDDAPLPFMAFLPGSLEKLLGIYFVTRIAVDMFQFKSGTPVSVMMMVLGGATILFAVMMALIQHDYKRLLAYHSISQVGYMILGIGTATPIGVVGGIYHALNNAVYKSCLFLTAGSVERECGTSDLEKLGGLRKRMPVTFACFMIAAASISGVPPFNGFFSKELIFEGALENGVIYYVIAAVGAFFTAASFLKLGHAVYFGRAQRDTENATEAPLSMLAPMIVLSALCVLFGVYNRLPLKYLIEPVLGNRISGTFSGMPKSPLLTAISLAILLIACLDHIWGFRRTGSGLKSVDHFHYAPGLVVIYGWAERKYFDLYQTGRRTIGAFAKGAFKIDRAVNWVYDVFLVNLTKGLSSRIRKAHNGDQSMYLGWSIAGMIIVVILAEIFR